MDKTIPGGVLIAIEGIDGAGKTTLAAALANKLETTHGLTVAMSKEPTNGPHGAALRATAATGRLSPQDELALLVADRRDHVRDLIAPALAAGQVVILDRYYFSNIAYQGAEGLDTDAVAEANAFAPAPHRVLLLDLPVAEGLARIRARGDKANAFETSDTLEAVRGIFKRTLPRGEGGKLIDASQPAEAVLQQAYAEVLLAISGRFRDTHGLTVESAERLLEVISSAA